MVVVQICTTSIIQVVQQDSCHVGVYFLVFFWLWVFGTIQENSRKTRLLRCWGLASFHGEYDGYSNGNSLHVKQKSLHSCKLPKGHTDLASISCFSLSGIRLENRSTSRNIFFQFIGYLAINLDEFLHTLGKLNWNPKMDVCFRWFSCSDSKFSRAVPLEVSAVV